MADYAAFFKDEPSLFIWLPLSKLKTEYVAVEVINYPTYGQVRPAFWVASDGVKLLVYFTSGLADVLSLSQVKISKVIGAKETKVVDGKLWYMMDDSAPWKELGPVTEHASSDEGIRLFNTLKCAHMKNKPSYLEEDERRYVRKALTNDFWAEGRAF